MNNKHNIVKDFVILSIPLSLLISPIIGLIGVFVMWSKLNWRKNTKILLTIAFLIIAGVNLAFWQFMSTHLTFQMAGESMSPAYKSGGDYITDRFKPGMQLKRGDPVVFKDPQDTSHDFLKRIIGLPGDTIMLQDGEVYLNGEKLDESYVNGTKTYGSDFLKDGQTVTVPAGNYFILGDNRLYSSDSRIWGFVPQGDIVSIVKNCYLHCK